MLEDCLLDIITTYSIERIVVLTGSLSDVIIQP